MSTPQERGKRLTRDELRRAFQGELGDKFPPVLSPEQVAELLGYSRSTIYYWVAKGRFDGAVRKRGKHARFWRDRVMDLFFNGPEWTSSNGESKHEQ